MQTFFADIALAFPSQTPFQYSVPQNSQDQAAIGKRVFVSVRTRRMVGYVVGFSSVKAFDEIRELDSVIDESPILNPAFLELTRWMSEYYLCSWGQAIEAALPLPAVEVRALVPYDRGDLVSAIHEQGILLDQEHEEGGTAVHARVGQHLAARLAPFEV